MAKEEHLKILGQGIGAWNLWRNLNCIVTPDLRGADLRGADLRGANLSRADLGDAHLEAADLRGANLSRADLSRADLGDAHLEAADLGGADLEHANLGGANLLEAYLEGAKLVHANLWSAHLGAADLGDANLEAANLKAANLWRANLEGADLGDAALWATAIGNVDLSKTKDLTVLHLAPSTIGADTLERTAVGLSKDPSRQGEIETFFRGAGLSEELIDAFRSLIGKPIEFYSCFISYSRADKSFARRLHDDLQMRGIRCWLDEHQLLPGDDIYEGVDRGIRLWDKVLLCCSEAALTSWWVDKEIATALNKEQKLMRERAPELQGRKVLCMIPLNLDGYLLSGQWQSGKAQDVLTRLAADFTGWERDNDKFQRTFEVVVSALRADAGAREEPPAAKI